MPEMADILRRYGAHYLKHHGSKVLPSHRRAIRAILACRTAAMGGELYGCPDCDDFVYRYHSCRHRACPKCHSQQTRNWLEARRNELIDAPYFHIVFTVPSQLRRFIRSNQRILYAVLMRAAFQALQDLAWDPKFLGGRIGALCILHTWTRTLGHHPHVHILVPGVGLDRDGRACTARQSFLVPTRALSTIFAAKFIAMARKELPKGARIPRTPKKWHCFVKPAINGGDRVLQYLARYVFRHAITNSRIVSIDDGRVCFRYQNSETRKWAVMELEADEFLRRFLQHVLPSRFHKVRYFGLWHPRCRDDLHRLITLFGQGRTTCQTPTEEKPPPSLKCPSCGGVRLHFIGKLPRSPRPLSYPSNPRPPPAFIEAVA